MKKKYNRIQLVEDVINMRIKKGYTVFMIVEYITKDLGFCKRTAERIIAEARDKIASLQDRDYSKTIEEDIQRLEMNYSECLKEGNRKLALEFMKEINKLKGHYLEKINLSGNVDFNVKFPGLNDDEE